MKTRIAWAGHTHPFFIGCSRVALPDMPRELSPCDRCYAMRNVHRQLDPRNRDLELTILRKGGRRPGVDWTGRIRLVVKSFHAPARWRKPRLLFSNSQSDPFHRNVPRWATYAMWAVMAGTPDCTWMTLTKRPDRAADFLAWLGATPASRREQESVKQMQGAVARSRGWLVGASQEEVDSLVPFVQARAWAGVKLPLANVWLGTSTGGQQMTDYMVPKLLKCSAHLKFISNEPQLEDVTSRRYLGPGMVEWVIQGGESGVGARGFHIDWARKQRDECRGAGVSFFPKQLGRVPLQSDGTPIVLLKPDDHGGWKRDPKGEYEGSWPLDLQGLRSWPEQTKAIRALAS